MGQFLNHVDPNTRKITRGLEEIRLKIINKQCSIVFNKTCLNNNLLPIYALIKITFSFRFVGILLSLVPDGYFLVFSGTVNAGRY